MYLVTESEYAQLKKKQPPPPSQPRDAQVLSNSMKAVVQKRKREAIRVSVPASKLRKYDVGVVAMKEAAAAKPRRGARARERSR